MAFHRNYSRPMLSTMDSPVDATANDIPFSPTNVRRSNEAMATTACSAEERPLSPASSSSTHVPSLVPAVQRRERSSFMSDQSNATSLYPRSTSTFSGPETPPSPASYTSSRNLAPDQPHVAPIIQADDISSRLRLLAVNSYFLPPPHAKPSLQELSGQPNVPSPAKSPILRDLFRIKPPTADPPPQQTSTPPPSFKPPRSGRLIVIREQLSDLECLPSLPPPVNDSNERVPTHFEWEVDPTRAVDVEWPKPNPTPAPQQEITHDPWKKDLLQQAVGLSFGALPPTQPKTSRKFSLVTEIKTEQQAINPIPISKEVAPSPRMGPTSPLMEERGRQDNKFTTHALPPPPRAPRSRSRKSTNPSVTTRSNAQAPTVPSLPATYDPASGPSRYGSFEEPSIPSAKPSMSQRPSEDIDFGRGVAVFSPDIPPVTRASDESMVRASQSSRGPYWDGAFSMSPPNNGFQSMWPPQTDEYTRMSTSYSVAHSRPSLTESMGSAPRESTSSRISYRSTTFGVHHTEAIPQVSRESLSPPSSMIHIPSQQPSGPTRTALFGRARSSSPSRTSVASRKSRGHASETEGGSTVILGRAHGDRGLTSSQLDRTRGITNAPPPSSTPSLFGIMSKPKSGLKTGIASTPYNTQQPGSTWFETTDDDEEAEFHANKSSLEAWRESQAAQDSARKLEGMLVQHMEQEREHIKRIAHGQR